MANLPDVPRPARGLSTQHSAIGLYLLVIAIILPAVYLVTTSERPRSARNVVLVIAEGLSMPLVQQARATRPSGLALDELPVFGITSASSPYGIAPDRASVATALATGYFGPAGHLNALAEDDLLRLSRPTLLDIANERGRVTGLLTTDEVSSPMVAAFGARTVRATDAVEVLTQILQKAQPTMLLGGGKCLFESGPLRARARGVGYRMIHSVTDFQPAGRDVRRTLALFADGPIPFYARMGDSGMSLPKMVRMAVAGLRENDRGYFLVVHEGGIRRAAMMHREDLNHDGRVDEKDARAAFALALDEVHALDETVALLQKISAGKDTLLVVAGAVDWGGPCLVAGPRDVVPVWTADGATPADMPLWAEGPGSKTLAGHQRLTRLFHTIEHQLVQPL